MLSDLMNVGEWAACKQADQGSYRTAGVLTDVLKRADERAGELAEVADQARARGVTCEQAYDSLGK